MIKRRHWYVIVPLLAAILLLLILVRHVGPQYVFIPAINRQTEPLKLMRPGTTSIILSGPLVRNCVFEINPAAAGLRPLDWVELTSLDRMTDVIVTATVGRDGALSITRINDRGHPEAGQYIRERLSTWVYTTCKHGIIRFWFNAGALQITIDATQLVVSNPAGAPVNDGQMHFVIGGGVRIQYGVFLQ